MRWIEQSTLWKVHDSDLLREGVLRVGDSETIRLPYEEGELLEYLDAEELPPILVDLLEKSQTLICDVHAITSDNHKWTQDDKLLLESHLLLATAEPLCLDPSISVTCTANRLLYNKQKMNTRSMKRCFKRYSRPSLNRQQEMAHLPTPPQLKLFDYLQKRKERKPAPPIDLKISRAGNCVDMWKQNHCQLIAPSEVDVEKYATVEKSIKLDDSQPTVWPAHDVADDYLFECEEDNQSPKTTVTIYRSVGDPLFYGKIQTTKEPKADDEGYKHLIHPPFLIGSKIDADSFTFGFPPCSLSFAPLNTHPECRELQAFMQQPEGVSGSVQSSVLGKGVKHRPPPIKLPAGPGSSSSGNLYSSQQSGGHLKSPTPPPSKGPSLSRKHSMELNQVGLLSPAALSPVGSSQRSGTPKPSTPTPTNTPSSTPHPSDIQTSTPSATPTPQDSALTPQPTLLNPFTQQQMAQALPVMTIPLSTITTGTSSNQVMTNPAGLNFINVVGSVW
ncbi:UNVERIFIED_CONTAM: hypothetical protein FKN15_018366 [Acipenser sinensis]